MAYNDIILYFPSVRLQHFPQHTSFPWPYSREDRATEQFQRYKQYTDSTQMAKYNLKKYFASKSSVQTFYHARYGITEYLNTSTGRVNWHTHSLGLIFV